THFGIRPQPGDRLLHGVGTRVQLLRQARVAKVLAGMAEQCGDHLVGELAREHAMTVDVRQLAVVVDDDVAWRDARGTHGADRVSGANRHREQWSHLQKNTPLANAAVDPTMGSQRDTSKARVVEELPVSRQVSEACTSRATRIIRSRLRHRVAIAGGRAWK